MVQRGVELPSTPCGLADWQPAGLGGGGSGERLIVCCWASRAEWWPSEDPGAQKANSRGCSESGTPGQNPGLSGVWLLALLGK